MIAMTFGDVVLGALVGVGTIVVVVLLTLGAMTAVILAKGIVALANAYEKGNK